MNFNPYKPVTDFENLFSGFSSKRKDLQIREDNWLNTATDLTDANNPASLDYTSDFIDNAIANTNNKFIVGTDTYQYTDEDIYKNGKVWEDDESAGSSLQALSPSAQPEVAALANPFCSWCADCKNWKRRRLMSFEYTDDQGRNWKFDKVIAIRGINPRLKGYAVGSIRAYREVRSGKWKKKRAYLGIQMQGYFFKNRCTTPYPFAGTYLTSRARIFYRRHISRTEFQFTEQKETKLMDLSPSGRNRRDHHLLKTCL